MVAGAGECELERPDGAGGVGQPFAGDAECGAVVRAGAVAWQAEGDIDSVVKIE